VHIHFACARLLQYCYMCQVSQLGMSDRVGNVSFEIPQSGEMVVTKPYSEQTAQIIDEEVRTLIKTAYDSTFKLLTEHKDDIEKVCTCYIYSPITVVLYQFHHFQKSVFIDE